MNRGHRGTNPEITLSSFRFATTVNVVVRYMDLTCELVSMVRGKGETTKSCVQSYVDLGMKPDESDWPCEIMHVSHRGKVVWKNPKLKEEA